MVKTSGAGGGGDDGTATTSCSPRAAASAIYGSPPAVSSESAAHDSTLTVLQHAAHKAGSEYSKTWQTRTFVRRVIGACKRIDIIVIIVVSSLLNVRLFRADFDARIQEWIAVVFFVYMVLSTQ